MSSEVKVPTLGESVSEATIGQWLKQPGEAVALDEALVSLETDKVAIEVNAPAAGVLGAQLFKEGDNVSVGALLATIEDGGAALLHLGEVRRIDLERGRAVQHMMSVDLGAARHIGLGRGPHDKSAHFRNSPHRLKRGL